MQSYNYQAHGELKDAVEKAKERIAEARRESGVRTAAHEVTQAGGHCGNAREHPYL